MQIRFAATALPSQAPDDGATSDAGLLGDAPNTPLKNTPSKGERIYDELHIYGAVADHAQRQPSGAGARNLPGQCLHPHAFERLSDDPNRQAHGGAKEQAD